MGLRRPGELHGPVFSVPEGKHLPQRRGADLCLRRGVAGVRQGHALLPVVPGGDSQLLTGGEDLLPDPQDGLGAGGSARVDFQDTTGRSEEAFTSARVHRLPHIHLGRDAVPRVELHRLPTHPERQGLGELAPSVRNDPRCRRGAAVRAGDVPRDLALPAEAPLGLAPVRESLQHHQTVQALMRQVGREVSVDGGEEQSVCGLHRHVHQQHVHHGDPVE